jgi:hypothetical protein
MLYLLSKLIPVPMRSTYGVCADGEVTHHEHATWVQWRDRIFRHRVQALT